MAKSSKKEESVKVADDHKSENIEDIKSFNYGSTFDTKDVYLSYSSLKQFRKSPLHFMHYKNKPKEPASDAMNLGTAVDVLILTPDQFNDKIAVMPELNLRTNQGKADKEAFIDANKGKTIITAKQHEVAKLMSESALNNKAAQEWIKYIKRTQITLKWKYKETGHKIISKVDFDGDHPERGFFAGEIKTAASADTEDFIRAAYNLDYHVQAGSYKEAYMRKSFKFPIFVYIVIESSEPYAVNVLVAEPNYLEYGKNEFLGTLKVFKYCQDNELFHQGYEFKAFDGENTMRSPAYKRDLYGNF